MEISGLEMEILNLYSGKTGRHRLYYQVKRLLLPQVERSSSAATLPQETEIEEANPLRISSQR